MSDERSRCPAVHDSEVQCEGPDDGHTSHYFTHEVTWECCPSCRGERQAVYVDGKFTGRFEIKHEDHCPKLPMTLERAKALTACRCPSRPCLHCDAMFDLRNAEGERLVKEAEAFLKGSTAAVEVGA